MTSLMPRRSIFRRIPCRYLASLLIGVFMAVWQPVNVRATGLILEDLTMHLPWVSYQESLFKVNLAFFPDDGGIYFSLANAQGRNATPPSGAGAVLGADFSMQVPILSFQGELYRLGLTYAPQTCLTCFQLTSAVPINAPPQRGTIQSVELLDSLSSAELTTLLLIAGITEPPATGVSLYKVIYNTVDPFNRSTQASGLMALPEGSGSALPLLSYQHGTLTEKDEAPSAVDLDVVSVIIAASGYAVSAPDYLGLGDSSGLHPFVHAKSLATAVIDMLRAVRSYCQDNDVSLNGQLFLGGYSEGGFATMSAHKEMEINHPGEFAITASAPAAGPYDMSETMLDMMLSEDPVPNPYYLPYVMLTYDSVYGLADDYAELFASPYDQTIPPLFDGNTGSGTINAALPDDQKEILTTQVLETLVGDAPTPFKTMLVENDVYRWVPKAALRLYHCTGDESVPYANATKAFNYFQANGASDVELVSLNSGGHVACAIPAMLQIKGWFDSLVD